MDFGNAEFFVWQGARYVLKAGKAAQTEEISVSLEHVRHRVTATPLVIARSEATSQSIFSLSSGSAAHDGKVWIEIAGRYGISTVQDSYKL